MEKCEICQKEFKYLENHHIQSKSKGGGDEAYNLCHLCPNCHTLVHMGDYIIEGKYLTSQGYLVVCRKHYDEHIITKDVPKVFTY